MPPDGIINATTFNVAEGAVLTFVKNEFNTPVFILAEGDVTIAGTIDVSGFPGNNTVGGQSGPGGFNGGTPGGSGVSPSDGQGPGGGKAGTLTLNQTGSVGSGFYSSRASENSQTNPQKGITYGSALLIPMIGGSGAGGTIGSPGWGGSGGGGAILIASNTKIEIASTGNILANGGWSPWASDSRILLHGSGGAVRLVAPQVLGTGTVRAQPRNTSPTAYNAGTKAGYGRIRVDAIDRSGIGITFVPSSRASVGSNMVVFPTPTPRLDITEVADDIVPLDTASGVSVLLPFNAPSERTVTVRAQDFNKVVNFVVVLQPVNGSRILVPASVDNSTNNPASVAVDVTLPLNTQTEIFVWTVPDP